MATPRPINFRSDAEKTKWIIENAAYYRTFAYLGRIRYGDNYKTLAQAEKAAQAASGALHKPIMIYAVAADGSGTWIKTITCEVTNAAAKDAEGRNLSKG